jgi:hypothetical protein
MLADTLCCQIKRYLITSYRTTQWYQLACSLIMYVIMLSSNMLSDNIMLSDDTLSHNLPAVLKSISDLKSHKTL